MIVTSNIIQNSQKQVIIGMPLLLLQVFYFNMFRMTLILRSLITMRAIIIKSVILHRSWGTSQTNIPKSRLRTILIRRITSITYFLAHRLSTLRLLILSKLKHFHILQIRIFLYTHLINIINYFTYFKVPPPLSPKKKIYFLPNYGVL